MNVYIDTETEAPKRKFEPFVVDSLCTTATFAFDTSAQERAKSSKLVSRLIAFVQRRNEESLRRLCALGVRAQIDDAMRTYDALVGGGTRARRRRLAKARALYREPLSNSKTR